MESQEHLDLLRNDEFLKGPNGELFTNAKFHQLMTSVYLINKDVPAPQLAFVLKTVVDFLSSAIDSTATHDVTERSSFLSGGADKNSVYKSALQFALSHGGKHWSIRTSASGQPPTQTFIQISVPSEVARPPRTCLSETYLTLLTCRHVLPFNSRYYRPCCVACLPREANQEQVSLRDSCLMLRNHKQAAHQQRQGLPRESCA
jgi:hypothetical protein